jgi:hypothetical protein
MLDLRVHPHGNRFVIAWTVQDDLELLNRWLTSQGEQNGDKVTWFETEAEAQEEISYFWAMETGL